MPYKTLETKRVINIRVLVSPLTDEESDLGKTTYPQLLEDGEELIVPWKEEAAVPLTRQD
uniref:Uncharacterized protein n=1 Tax=Hyaloperonospora arabidopsidis (strain Emoy2) TaxID=559515 RepID=M4B6V0_HYAAE